MSVATLGYVKSPSEHSYRVRWDSSSHHLYIGGYHLGKANDPAEAMQKAKDWVFKRTGRTRAGLTGRALNEREK